MDAVWNELQDLNLLRIEAPIVSKADLLRVHTKAHLDRIIRSAPVEGTVALDADTHMSSGSLSAAYRAAGGAVRAVDAVLSGEAKNAFVAMRPPGHHAERETPMGFCLFGNVAVAAKYALDQHELSRVAIVDFDVHHGNGTQDLVQSDKRILFISTHQMPLYPGTGYPTETGGHNNVLNVPLDGNSDGAVLQDVMERKVLPRVRAHRPDLIFISAGFDAHISDPLAGLALVERDFASITTEICALAQEICQGKVVSCLEGGYDLEALGKSARAHVNSLITAGQEREKDGGKTD